MDARDIGHRSTRQDLPGVARKPACTLDYGTLVLLNGLLVRHAGTESTLVLDWDGLAWHALTSPVHDLLLVHASNLAGARHSVRGALAGCDPAALLLGVPPSAGTSAAQFFSKGGWALTLLSCRACTGALAVLAPGVGLIVIVSS
jgi:hypothetical protein